MRQEVNIAYCLDKLTVSRCNPRVGRVYVGRLDTLVCELVFTPHFLFCRLRYVAVW